MSGVVLAAGRSSRMGRDKALLEAPEGGLMWERQRDVLAAAGAREIFLSARPEQAWARAAVARARATRAEGERSGRGESVGEGGGIAVAGVLHDALPDCGPLVGITAALERAVTATHVAVLAVDLPRLAAAWLVRLREASGSGVGAVGRRAGSAAGGGPGSAGDGGFFEPLAAIYPREMMWLAWEALAAGDYALQRLVARATEAGLLRTIEIGAAELDWFANWNERGTVGR
jgi:molybdopterin-guanine dinucleotide biosynthesis protein A